MVASLFKPARLIGGQVKPPGIPKIDWTHPLANGLRYYYINSGGSFIDLVTGDTAPAAPGVNWPGPGVTPYGAGVLNTARTHIQSSFNAPRDWARPFSWACAWYQIGAVASSSGFPTYFGINDSLQNDAMQIYRVGTGNLEINDNNGANIVSLGAAPTSNAFHTAIGITKPGDNGFDAYYDGAFLGTTSTATNTITSASLNANTKVVIANSAANPSGADNDNLNSMIFYGAVWLRELTPAEALQLWLDPYCFLVWPQSDIVSTPFGVAGPPPLTGPAPQVWFDPELIVNQWFDPELNLVAWFDRELADPSFGALRQTTLFTNTNNFFTHTVTPGAVALTQTTLFSNTSNFFAHTVASTYSLTQTALFSNAQNFFTHVVTPGAVALTQTALFQNTNNFFAHTVSSTYPLTQTTLFVNTNNFFTHTVLSTANIAPTALFINANNFFAHTVTPGAVALTQTALFQSTNNFFTHDVSQGATALTQTTLFVNTNNFFAHDVSQGASVLTQTALFTNTNNFFTHTVSSVYPLTQTTLFSNAQNFFAHTIATSNTLAPALFTNTQNFFTHTVSSTVALTQTALFSNANNFFAHTVSASYALTQTTLFSNGQNFFTHAVSVGAAPLVQTALFVNQQTFFGATVALDGVVPGAGASTGAPFIANMGFMMIRGGGGGGVAPVANWVDDWKIGGTVMPSIVLDFAANRYYDGSSNSAALSSMVQNASLNAGGLKCDNPANNACLGPLLAALLQTTGSVCVETINGVNNTIGGIVSLGSGGPDFMLLQNGTAATVRSFNGTIVDSTATTAFWAQITRMATNWNASDRRISLVNFGAVATGAGNYTPSTTAVLGSWNGTDAFLGQIRRLAVYPTKVSDLQLKGLSGWGYWWLPFNGACGVFPTNAGDNIQAGNVLQYNFTQPWTMECSANVATIGGTQVFFTNVGVGAPFTGYEVFFFPDGKLRSRIMSAWDGVVGHTGIIDVNGGTVFSPPNSPQAQYLAVTYDGSGVAAGIKMYVNGVPETLTTVADTLTGSSASPDAFWIGNQVATADPVKAILGPFIMSNRARSAAEIAARAASPRMPAVDADTVLYYDFREGSGTTTADRSASGFTGTLSSGSLWP